MDSRNQFDGYRVQVQLANEAVRVFTRRGHDWTHRFKKVADDAWHIKAGSAIVDGEIVVPAADGSTDFSILQNTRDDLQKRRRQAENCGTSELARLIIRPRVASRSIRN